MTAEPKLSLNLHVSSLLVFSAVQLFEVSLLSIVLGKCVLMLLWILFFFQCFFLLLRILFAFRRYRRLNCVSQSCFISSFWFDPRIVR